MIVYCATSNPGKLREFQLAAPDFDVRPLPAKAPPPEENGATFEENAAAKAKYYGRFVDGYLFADDSGLEVDALDGAPGVRSARYAGEARTGPARPSKLSGTRKRSAERALFKARSVVRASSLREATDRENNALLLERLKDAVDRSARFVCVIALVKDAALVKTFRGTVEGRILHEPRGEGGFGYDPLFYYESFGRTFGEELIERKMKVSHRAQALEAMFTFLRNSAAI